MGRGIRLCGLLVWPDAAMDFRRAAHARGNLLGGNDRLGVAGFEFLATRHACHLFRLLSVVREHGTGFFGISVRWNALGSRIHCTVFRASWIPAGVGRREPAIARELVFAGLGMLPDLFRIGRGENHRRRPAMAQFYGPGRLLPHPSPAYLCLLVKSALS